LEAIQKLIVKSYECLGHYFLVLPLEVAKIDENKVHLNHIVSLDPGVRTFQTTYDTAWVEHGMRQKWYYKRVLSSSWQAASGLEGQKGTSTAFFQAHV